MAESFDRASALSVSSPEEHVWEVPDGWQQGRGAFGGLVVGAMLDAMRAREPDAARLPRAFTGELCGPTLPGRSRVQTQVLRRGNNQTNVAANLLQGEDLVAHATLTMATARRLGSPLRLDVMPPARPRWQDLPLAPIGPPLGPVFAQHYEFRVFGALPFSGASEPVVTGFVREKVALPRVTYAAMLARLDAFYPATFPIEPAPRPVATVSFLAELLVDPGTLDPEEPLFFRSRVLAQGGGYFVELRELWSGDVPVALNQQSIAMLG